jgi:multidrug efflux pump subunit AcrB
MVIIACIGVLVLSYLAYRNLGSEFLPEFDEGAFVLDYATPPGTSLTETDRILKHVEEIIQEVPEVEGYSRRTGLELGLFITEPNTGDFAVKLKDDRKRSTEEVKDEIRKQIASTAPSLSRVELPGILGDMIGDLSSEPQPVEIKLFSEDANALHQKATEIEEVIKKIPGVVDTFNGVVVSGPAITFRIDPQRAAALGVNATDVAGTVTTAMTGEATSVILQQDRLINVRVVLPKELRTSLDALRALQIRSPAKNSLFRLDQVADIEYDKGQTEIARDGLRRTVAITARLEGLDLGSAIRAIQTKLAKEVKLPPGMTLEYGGLYREQQSSFGELTLALALAVALVFVTLLIEFRSFSHPSAIVTGAVLALSGVLAALLITGTTLNVVSYMGMIMVVGIVAKNGILMLDAVEDHLTAGDSLRDALLRSGRRRFRPVLMTSLAAMLGMLPLALALGQGSEMLQPLAIAVIGGLMVALLLSLVVTPTVYAMLRTDRTR